MLEELSKQDKKWRSIALKLTGNKQAADDLVQDAYLKMYDISVKYPDKEIKPAYMFSAIYTLFMDKCRSKKYEIDADELPLSAINEQYELDDEDLELIEKVKRMGKAYYPIYLELLYEYSLREVAEMLNTDYGFIYRKAKEARMHVLKDDYDKKYKNKRNKHK